MYNTKFLFSDNTEIYPGYLNKEKREEIKKRFGSQKGLMRCGCKPKENLFYRISEDLRIYPEHNNYEHATNCSRYRPKEGEAQRQAAYLINEEDGEVKAFLSFNPKQFSTENETEVETDLDIQKDTEEQEIENELIIEKPEEDSKKQEKKEPKLSLPGLVRCINLDAFSEKVLNGKQIENRENFSKFVFHRMKKIKASGMRKSIGDLTLESDGVRFIYVPFAGAVKRAEKGLVKCYIQTVGENGKVYNNFIFPDTLEKAVKEFVKMYGIEPDKNTMIAGFQYYKKGRNKSMYRVLGRIHLFQISGLGIYCRSLIEQSTFNTICKIQKADSNIKFWIPPEDDSIGGIIQIRKMEKRILLLFRKKKDERITFDVSQYEPLVVDDGEAITREYLYDLLKN